MQISLANEKNFVKIDQSLARFYNAFLVLQLAFRFNYRFLVLNSVEGAARKDQTHYDIKINQINLFNFTVRLVPTLVNSHVITM